MTWWSIQSKSWTYIAVVGLEVVIKRMLIVRSRGVVDQDLPVRGYTALIINLKNYNTNVKLDLSKYSELPGL